MNDSQLEQLLMNLAVNARDAMADGGRFSIEVSLSSVADARSLTLPAQEWVTITAADTGNGMPSSVLERIFEPFYTTKDLGKGTGLGLAICYSNIREAGGHIRVNSTPGRGTVFDIYLPRVMHAEAQVQRSSVHPSICGTETILLVDDDPEIGAAVSRILHKAG